MARVEVSRKNESESAAANKSRSNNMKGPFGKAEYWNVQIYGIITLQLGDKLPTDKGNHVCLLLLFFFYLHLCCVKTLSSARRDLMKRWASSWQNDCWWSHESANYNYWLHFLITRSFECSVVRASGELCQKKKENHLHTKKPITMNWQRLDENPQCFFIQVFTYPIKEMQSSSCTEVSIV